jgi:hypothetical protein
MITNYLNLCDASFIFPRAEQQDIHTLYVKLQQKIAKGTKPYLMLTKLDDLPITVRNMATASINLHPVTKIPTLYYIGGKDSDSDIDVFDIQDEKWVSMEKNISLHNTFPLWGLSSTVINDKIYIFGGFDSDCIYNKLMSFDGSHGKLDFEHGQGTVPYHRGNHSAVAYREKIIFFGGATCTAGSYTYYNDVLSYHTKKNKWKKHTCTGDVPPPRSQHTATLLGDIMFVIGGYNGHTIVSNIYALDLNTMHWSEINPIGRRPKNIKGMKPVLFRFYPARHTVAVLKSNPDCAVLLVHGLCNNQFLLLHLARARNDEWISVWTPIKSKSEIPKFMGGHVMSKQDYGPQNGSTSRLYIIGTGKECGFFRIEVENVQ